MKKVLFVLICVAAVAAMPACKYLSCQKEAEVPVIPTTEQTAPMAPAPVEAPVAPAMPAAH